MYLLTDVDDTLLDWFAGFQKFAEERLGRTLGVRPNLFELEDWLGVDQKFTDDLIYEFNNGDWRFGYLQPMNKSESVLPIVHTLGYKIVAITACSSMPQAIALRQANLAHVYGDIFSDVVCIGLNEPKSSYLRKFEPSLWIEDNFKKAIEGFEVGHTTLCIRRPQNVAFRNDTRIQWIDSWLEVVKKL